ncbi:MAG TPA: A/G-specific adenine glycosylase [Casimicrobiaceae bacterium]|nr:A/G-specific adenine glycosylase [Casimicrobiaceae bacterium]
MSAKTFAARILLWHRRHGRHDLPWQGTRDPYRIWLSEVMLQQTQVTSVIPYFQRFVEAFPDLASLAAASLDDVMRLWSGLGYYRRARHLHEAARIIVREHHGVFPRDVEAIAALPGIGRSTAAAIAAFAFGTRGAILDGNVKRVLARHCGVEGYPGSPQVEGALWNIAEAELPETGIEAYTQAMMDLGATVCVRSRPRCDACPVANDCIALRTHRVEMLPTPRPARVLPQREVDVLMIESDGAWLFERRGSAGVWSGLWSLPELARGDDPVQSCRLRFGLEVSTTERLPPIEHAFTHYRLTMHPVRLVAASPLVQASAPDRAWITSEAAIRGALPAPIKRLVQRHAPRSDLFA